MSVVTLSSPVNTPSTAEASSSIAPLDRRTLHDAVVDRVRTLVVEGQLAPGARIHESQLGNALGVSRTPLREALKVLASEGLIELVPGRGAVVKRLTQKDVRDMLDVLVALEMQAARLACANAPDDAIRRLRVLHDEMMALYAARNRLECYWRNQAIHAGLAALSGNTLLTSLHQTIAARLKRIRFIGNEEPEKWAGAVGEHEEMIVALEARDDVRLCEVIRRHLDQTWTRVVDKI